MGGHYGRCTKFPGKGTDNVRDDNIFVDNCGHIRDYFAPVLQASLDRYRNPGDLQPKRVLLQCPGTDIALNTFYLDA